jgi:hypothetical protein
MEQKLELSQELVCEHPEAEPGLWDLISELSHDVPEQSAVLGHLCNVSTQPAAAPDNCVRMPPFAALESMPFDVAADLEKASSASSSGSLLHGLPNPMGYGAFGRNGNAYSPIGLYGASAAQLQNTPYMQGPTQAMQLQADPCAAGAVLRAHQPPAMAASWGPQPGSMAMPAPAQHWQVWVPASDQEPQLSVRAISKRRAESALDSVSSDDPNDDDYNPYQGDGACWQPNLHLC